MIRPDQNGLDMTKIIWTRPKFWTVQNHFGHIERQGRKQQQKSICLVQLNLCLKLSFSNQLTHDMTRLFIEFQEIYKLTTCCVQKLFFCFCFDIQNNICTQHVVNLYFSWNSMNILSSYCGLKFIYSEKAIKFCEIFT